MRKFSRRKRHIASFMFDHRGLTIGLSYTKAIIVCIVASFIYAFGFTTFITGFKGNENLITGGLSGFGQNIILILEMCGVKGTFTTMQSIIYFVLNIPILIFAFIKLSKRFAICSAICVGISSLFIYILGINGFAKAIGSSSFLVNSPLSRALFAGICSGVSASICFEFDVSCGGFDVISYYASRLKSTGAGKIGAIFSGCVVVLYAILTISKDANNWSDKLIVIFYSITYMLIVGLVTDAINVKNRKVEIKIISSNVNMCDILIALFPHSMTIVEGKGAFSHQDKQVIFLVVSSSEVKQIVTVIKRVDPNVFVTTTPIGKVFGNFFVKPIE